MVSLPSQRISGGSGTSSPPRRAVVGAKRTPGVQPPGHQQKYDATMAARHRASNPREMALKLARKDRDSEVEAAQTEASSVESANRTVEADEPRRSRRGRHAAAEPSLTPA